MKLDITAIILTLNEEMKIKDCLDSVVDLCNEIIVVDSGSTDKTIEIAKQYTTNIFTHAFENYSKQRNWSLLNLEIKNDWILNLDADHRVSIELKEELYSIFHDGYETSLNGFLISRKTIFMGKWIKHGGHYPTYHANLFRKGFGKCEDKLYDQHYLIDGKIKILNGVIIDIITNSLSDFILRHNRWSTLEANYLLQKQKNSNQLIKANINGHPIEKRRALKTYYERFPLFFRVLLYFLLRYFLRFGFLDGREGLIFHFLQGFWFRFLIDAKLWELRKNN